MTFETFDYKVFEKFIQELPDKALRLGIRVVLAIIVFFVGTQLIKIRLESDAGF